MYSTPSTSFEKRETRLTKDNLYMVLALWMEKFPVNKLKENISKQLSSPSSSTSTLGTEFNKVGVVFVQPNDHVLSVDCSRDDVHGIARVIVKHCDKAEGCHVFVSRKPCSVCAKLLVQARVSRIFYLPIEPESHKPDDLEKVDRIFKVSPVAQSMFVPCVDKKVLTKEEMKRPANTTPDDVKTLQEQLFDEWWHQSILINSLDDKMKEQVESDFMSLMKWIASIKAPLDKAEMKFYKVEVEPLTDAEMTEFPGGPVAKHMITFAKMLARQTDDPKAGVGAVLMKGKEIVGIGWNGFPAKALYGEFPRASDDDSDTREKKYPYVLHAEQNALMRRNEKDLTDGILFVTKCPCDECAPLVKLSGVKTIVVGEDLKKSKGGILSYNKVQEYIKDSRGEFTCLEMRKARSPVASSSSARRKLSYEEENQKS
ncbi:cytidine and dCMP deaminase domain-containing protein 1 [Exaiptasia diaphana]|uniref:Cytidine and dCMP deaminase domain-containing protein 1 n=1 Tax=Exaiptasia diaphana TaxID=2652724 RepID=A0A913XGL7_EXADI|nr:cytidine and dCMP deaminase domain-containing protein 1 [Exaiptasia diaphana]KXJ26132.1 Cytidine and dCMP deaminase domain-containing protein 1 [Exaiptasia diaphana]